MKTLTAFTSEKVIVNRERASGSYGMLPYLAAKLCAELPVGAFSPWRSARLCIRWLD
jgi:hypothetical protein